MPPQPHLAIVGTIQQAISTLLTTYEPEFLRFGQSLFIAVTLAKAISLAIVAFGLIASAICALVGPIFVPFFIVPKLDWLFWSWFKAFVQYSFVPVVAFAFLMVFEQFIFRYLTTLPAGITEDYYLVYGLQALVVIGVFCLGIFLIPSLTSSIFSGRGGESIFP